MATKFMGWSKFGVEKTVRSKRFNCGPSVISGSNTIGSIRRISGLKPTPNMDNSNPPNTWESICIGRSCCCTPFKNSSYDANGPAPVMENVDL